MTLRAMPAGTFCSSLGLPSRTGRKREARLRETNLSPKNGGFCGWVGNPSKENKVLINKDAQPWIKKRSHKERTRDLWNTRRETQIQTNLDQPPWKNGQHQTPETRPQLQTSRKKRPWTTQETMAMRRCRNRLNDQIHGGRWWWW